MARQWGLAVVSLIATTILVTSCTTQPSSRPLIAATPIQMDSPGKGTHTYLIQVTTDEYQEIKVVQLGLDVQISVYGPRQKLRFKRDSPIGNLGRELVCFIAEPGTWRFEISAFDSEERGRYRITRSSRPAGESDHRRSEAFALSVGAEGKEPGTALEASQRSTKLWALDGDLEQQAMELWRQARLYDRLGQSDGMVAAYLRVAEMLNELGGKPLLAMVHHNLGTAYYSRGELEKAIEYYLLALAGRTRGSLNRAATLAVLGQVYIYAGSWEQARPLLDECRVICVDQGDRDRLALVHAEMGWMFHGEKDYAQALERYRQALDLVRGSSPEAEAVIGNYEAGTRLALGEPKKALEILASAVDQLPAESRSRPRLQVRMVAALIGLDRFVEAESLNTSLLDYFHDWPVESAHCHHHMARIQRGLGQPHRALAHMERLHKLMASLQSGTMAHGLRALYEARRISYAELYLDLLIETTSDTARSHAFRFAEGFRARSLATSLESLDDSTGADNPELAAHLEQLRTKISTAAMTFSRQTPGQEIKAETELNELLRRYDRALSATQSARKDAPELVSLSIEQIQQQLLDEETGLLFFAMGSERVYGWAVDQRGAIYRDLGTRRDLEGDARDFYTAVRDTDTQANQARVRMLAKKLSAALAPAFQHLAGRRRLLIVADGAFHFLPFAALVDAGETPHVTNREFVSAPACSVLTLLKQRQQQRNPTEGIAILAAPSYGNDLKPLPYAQEEAVAIAGIATSPMLLRQGHRADKALVLSGALNRVRYIHFACHGLFMERRPELSALILATRDDQGASLDGMLYPHEIEGLDLQAELVVLSACETALGKELRGEGLVGLSGSFLKAGCSGVLVSLWPVHDAATTELMTHFYKALYERGASPPEALRHAQSVLQRSENWQAPFYWAGFIYQGVW